MGAAAGFSVKLAFILGSNIHPSPISLPITLNVAPLKVLHSPTKQGHQFKSMLVGITGAKRSLWPNTSEKSCVEQSEVDFFTAEYFENFTVCRINETSGKTGVKTGPKVEVPCPCHAQPMTPRRTRQYLHLPQGAVTCSAIQQEEEDVSWPDSPANQRLGQLHH